MRLSWPAAKIKSSDGSTAMALHICPAGEYTTNEKRLAIAPGQLYTNCCVLRRPTMGQTLAQIGGRRGQATKHTMSSNIHKSQEVTLTQPFMFPTKSCQQRTIFKCVTEL
jgi:hypothetical protein